MMLAKDIMTKDVITVRPEEDVEKVAQLLLDNQISGVPVVDENHYLVGMITEKDLMIRATELKVPFYITLFDSIIFLENTIRFKNNLKKYTATQVKDAMTKKVFWVEEDTPVADIAELLQKENINRVPVLRHKKVMGIVTRNDLLKTMVKRNG